MEIYANIEELKPVQPEPHQGSRSSESSLSWYLLPCLGLLSLALLTGLVVVAVFLHLSTTELAATRTDLQMSEQRALLNASLASRMEELDRLQKSCQIGWTLFSNVCYYFSCELKSWEASRQSCRQVGADLVVVDSPEEQKFLSETTKKDVWIGLYDVETEGTWKWVDGNPLTKGYWYKRQPDNGNNDPQWGEEDCTHLYITQTSWEANWNDVACSQSLQWVCEKKLGE